MKLFEIFDKTARAIDLLSRAQELCTTKFLIYSAPRSLGFARDDSKSCSEYPSPYWRGVPLTPIGVIPSEAEGPKNHIIFDKLQLVILLAKNLNNSTSTFIIRYSIFIILFFLSFFSQAQPLLSSAKKIHGINLYQDANSGRYFYYEPGELIIAKNASQRPDFTLLLLRYTGNAATGDKGEIRYRNILRLGIQMIPPNKDSLSAVKSVLKSQNRRVILKPIPIQRLESVLIYNLVGEEKYEVLPTGEYDADREGNLTGRNTFWTERDYAISLDNHTAEIFEQALSKGQVVLSIGYAFITKGFAHDPRQQQIIGSHELVKEMNNRLKTLTDSLSSDSSATNQVVKSGAFSIQIDLNQWPNLIQKNDINEQLPPGYAALKIYNYDFNNELRPDLYSKRLEIKAVGAAGDTVNVHTEFSFRQPDLYATFIRFKYAIRLDKPFMFRSIETSHRGEEWISPWQTRSNWTKIVDITTKLERLNTLNLTETTERN